MEWRSLLDLFKGTADSPSPSQSPQLDLDSVVRELEIWKGFVGSPGWELLRTYLVREADECTKRWVRGGLDPRESDKLASRVETIGYVIEIPSQRLDDVVRLLNETDKTAPVSGDDLPFSCPVEPERG